MYKGRLPDGREVAVKQLNIGGSQGEREFRAEVEIISRIHHRHLVSLVGYCISEHQRLLVYDYVPNNTLHYHLHGKKDLWKKVSLLLEHSLLTSFMYLYSLQISNYSFICTIEISFFLSFVPIYIIFGASSFQKGADQVNNLDR